MTLQLESQGTIRASRATLHLTNGTSIIPTLREAGMVGRVMPWDDVLHEGAVPTGLNTMALRERRAEFLASCGWGSAETIRRKLAERDGVLEDLRDVDEVVLWFEHDLFDQLQLLQILDRLPLDGAPRVTAVEDNEYLGSLTSTRFRELFANRHDVTSSQRLAARDAWTAFRSPDPRAVFDVIARLGDLPHLAPALRRHLQQFPSMDRGLSRTELQTLEAVAAGATHVRDVYIAAHHNREEAIFMGDAAFVAHIMPLLRSPRPLLRASSQSRHPSKGRAVSEPPLSNDDNVELTDDGRLALEGRIDRVKACGIKRWLGGVELSGNGPVWRWDRDRLRFA